MQTGACVSSKLSNKGATFKLLEGKFLVSKLEFGGSFGMSLAGDRHEVEVTPYIEIVSHFWNELGVSLS
jgi:hypothetical protein